MSPQRIQAAADPAMAKTAALGSGIASALSFLQDQVASLLGVPIGVPLAALAAVLYGLTFREPMNARALWSNIIGCTFLASAGAPLAGYYLGTPAAVMAGVAAVIGFLTQYSHSWLKTRRDRLLDGATDRVLGPPPAPPPPPASGDGRQS